MKDRFRSDPRFPGESGKVPRRILPVPARSGGGRLPERTPAVQPSRRREWVKVPLYGHRFFVMCARSDPLVKRRHCQKPALSAPRNSRGDEDRRLIGARDSDFAPILSPRRRREDGPGYECASGTRSKQRHLSRKRTEPEKLEARAIPTRPLKTRFVQPRTDREPENAARGPDRNRAS